MAASAEEMRAALHAAVQKIANANEQVMAQIHPNVTDASVSLNNTSQHAQDAQRGYLSAIAELRDGIQLARQALRGTSNQNASGALVWLDKVEEDLNDDLLKIRALEEAVKEKVTALSGVVTNLEEARTFLIGAQHEIATHANTRV
jgi:phage terminase large subunit-like protein